MPARWPRPTSTNCVGRAAGGPPFLVVFDGVTDPHNLGSLLRSAECAGVTGVVVPRHRAAHVTPTVTKVAAGAVEHLAMAVVPGVPNALQRMTAGGRHHHRSRRIGADRRCSLSARATVTAVVST